MYEHIVKFNNEIDFINIFICCIYNVERLDIIKSFTLSFIKQEKAWDFFFMTFFDPLCIIYHIIYLVSKILEKSSS